MKTFSILLCWVYFSTLSTFQLTSGNVEQLSTNQSWEMLFDGQDPTKDWISVNGHGFPDHGWKAINGELRLLAGKKGGDIMTKRTYGDFIFEIEFKLEKNANTGIKYFVSPLQTNDGKVQMNGPEFQMIDDQNHESVKGGISPKTETGSLYLLYAPAENKIFKPFGQWNQARIVAKGKRIEHWLNGRKILTYERGSAEFRERVAKTKFAMYTSRYGEAATGHILITDHQDGASFRHIKIKKL